MSYVPEEVTSEDLWRVIPVETEDTGSSLEADTEVADVVEKYGL
jgi:hypothetical protein